MALKIEFFPENEKDKEQLERWKLLEMYMPSKFKRLSYNEAMALPKEERLKFYRFLFDSSLKTPKLKDDRHRFHKDLKRRLKGLESLSVKEQLEHYKKKITEISEAFKIFEITKVLEIEDGEIEIITEEFRLTKQIFEDKVRALEELNAPTAIEKIFQDQKFTLCYKLLVDMEIIDSITGKCLLTPRKGYLLFSAIAAIKHYSAKLLINHSYSYPYLLAAFNHYLNTNYVEVKTSSPGFKEYSKQAKEYLSKHL